MTTLWKSMLRATLWLTFVMFAAAQITNDMTFTTTFPFYAGNAKMPAGTYRVTSVQDTEGLLQIEATNGSHSAFVEYTSTQADSPHSQTDVTFKKYGAVDYLGDIWLQGQTSGMQMIPGKAEQVAAKNSSPSRHSVPGK